MVVLACLYGKVASCGLLHTMEQQACKQRGSLDEEDGSGRHGCERF